MEEVDKLIFQNLYSLGWEVEEVDNPCSFKNIGSSTIIKGLLLCLKMIIQESSLPSSLPSSMAHRFRVAAEMTCEIKNLGYTGDIGYHSILYPNEVDLRRIFMFLIEKLPKYSQDKVEETIGTKELIQQKAKNIIEESLSKPYESFYNSLSQTKNANSCQNVAVLSSQLDYHYVANYQRMFGGFNVGSKGNDAMLCVDVECRTMSKVTEAFELNDKSRDKVSLVDEHSNSTILSIVDEEISLMNSLHPIIEKFEEKEYDLSEIEHKISLECEKIEEEEKHLANIERASTLLLDATDNIAKLKVNIHGLKSREEKVLKQWLQFKDPLLMEITDLKSQTKEVIRSKQILRNEIFSLREELQVVITDAKVGEALAVELNEKVNKSPPGVNRSVYTKRIIDISSKVRKLKEEINKIVSDTRLLHKEINSLAGKLSRTFAVVEDSSFKMAKRNKGARQVYRCCVTIHLGCQRMCEVIRDTGHANREKADLMRRVDSARAKNVEENLKVLEEDLSKIEAENAILMQKLVNQRADTTITL